MRRISGIRRWPLWLAGAAAGLTSLAQPPARPAPAAQNHQGPALRGSGRLTLQLPARELQSDAAAESRSLLASADAVFQEMSRITGLPIKAPLKKKVVNRAEIRRYLTESLHAEYTPQEMHQQEAVLKAFGLVSREFNLGEFLITFYTEQAAGVYDQRSKTMLIADWVAPEMQQMVLAHELTHALQDQNFDLENFLRAVRDDDDASNARQAVVEGYATAAMMQKMVEPASLADLPALGPMMQQVVRMQTQELPAFSGAPFFFRFQALFPYTEGMSFMQRGLVHGGWPGLNRLFARPPGTTQEIFQPELYAEQRPRAKLALERPNPLGRTPELRFVNENAMGELGYYTLLGQFISEAEAKSVAGGWKADRYMVFENPAAGRYALVARTRWASPETSLAFFRDYHAILARKYAELASDLRSTEETYIGSTHSGKVILLREGDECLWVEGVPEAEVEPMLAYLRAQAKRAARAALFRSEVNQRGSVQYHSGSPNLAQ